MDPSNFWLYQSFDGANTESWKNSNVSRISDEQPSETVVGLDTTKQPKTYTLIYTFIAVNAYFMQFFVLPSYIEFCLNQNSLFRSYF